MYYTKSEATDSNVSWFAEERKDYFWNCLYRLAGHKIIRLMEICLFAQLLKNMIECAETSAMAILCTNRCNFHLYTREMKTVSRSIAQVLAQNLKWTTLCIIAPSRYFRSLQGRYEQLTSSKNINTKSESLTSYTRAIRPVKYLVVTHKLRLQCMVPWMQHY